MLDRRAFKEKLAAHSSGTPTAEHTQTTAKSPSVDALATQGSTANMRSATTRSKVGEYHCPSVAQYRGTTAIAKITDHRGQASRAEELSLPVKSIPDGFRDARHRSNEITRHSSDALLIGHGPLFCKATSCTGKGWKPGTFSLRAQ